MMQTPKLPNDDLRHSLRPPADAETPAVPILGVPMAAMDYAAVAAQVARWSAENRQRARRGMPGRAWAVDAANTHGLSLARHEPAFREALARFDLVLPDGMPVVWIMNARLRRRARLETKARAGSPTAPLQLRDRVYGPTLMLRLLQEPGRRHFLLGGTEEMLAALTKRLRKRLRGVEIAGSHAPPFRADGEWSADENALMRQKIAASGADCIWVGLGCPKQERWIARQKASLPPGVYFAVGAAFAFHAGMVKQAPPWMQRAGLEWLYRLLAEPRRLWRRTLTHHTLFIAYFLMETARRLFRRGGD